MQKPTLRNNQDGTCNCRPLGNGCFFQELDGSRCGCKCHTKPTFETTQCTFESDKWKGELVTLLNRKGLDHLPTENIYEDITDFISNLLAEQKKEILSQSDKPTSSHTNQLIEFEEKFVDKGYSSTGDGHDMTPDTWNDYWKTGTEEEQIQAISKLLYQTEQECDKKWKEKALGNEKLLKDIHRLELDAISCMSLEKFVKWSDDRKEKSKTEALQDLLNNK